MNSSSTQGVRFQEIRKSDWALIRELFGSRGACGGCWCMHWRRERGGQAWEKAKGEPNRRAFKKLVESGRAHGILARHGNQPVGWCSFGRRSDFPRLERTKAYRYAVPHTTHGAGDLKSKTHHVWAINCLFINKEYRGRGYSGKLVEVAVRAIRKRQGKHIESYPVTLTKDGRQLPPAFSFTGPEVIYRRLGFKEIQRLAPSRPLYCLELP